MKRELPKHVYPKGKKGYLYFCRGGTQRIQSPFPSDAFWAEYARLLQGVPNIPEGKSWKALIASYKRSERFTEKAPRTKKDYDRVLEYLQKRIGNLDPSVMKRKDVIRIRDANKDTVKFSRDCVNVISVCMEHAIDIGWREENPAKGVQRPKTPDSKKLNRQPWPPEMIEAFRNEAPIGTRARLIFELCLGTGQRIGDVLRLCWSDFRDQGFHLAQNKTGRRLFVPCTAALRDALSKTRRDGLFVVAGVHGKPLSYRQASHAVMQVRKAIKAEAYDIHALRHTTASELAGLGLPDEDIMAITGHSSKAMVVHYAGAARQRARAQRAQEARE